MKMRAGGFLSAGSAVTSKHIKDKTTGGCVAELSAWRARAALPVPEPDGAQQLSTRREKLALPTQWTAKIIEKKKRIYFFHAEIVLQSLYREIYQRELCAPAAGLRSQLAADVS